MNRDYWIVKHIDKTNGARFIDNASNEVPIDWEDITATDYEIREPTVTITRTQLYQALKDVESRLSGFNWDALAKRLGLGE